MLFVPIILTVLELIIDSHMPLTLMIPIFCAAFNYNSDFLFLHYDSESFGTAFPPLNLIFQIHFIG